MLAFIFSVSQKYRALLSLIYLGIIITLSLIPSEDVPQIALFEGFDKLVHFFMYLGFTWLLCWTLHAEKKEVIYYLIIFLGIFWGILMEVFQLIMHYGRSYEWMDILADSAGAVAGVVIYKLLFLAFKKQ